MMLYNPGKSVTLRDRLFILRGPRRPHASPVSFEPIAPASS
jgi:hypothetical protein